MIKIVLLEDEPLCLAELKLMTPWEQWDCMVAGCASDGISGLELIVETKPDIVVTDLRMPGLGGLELIKVVNEKMDEEAPQFIIISGYHDFEYARTAVELGAKSYLLKPVDTHDLESAIKRVSSALFRSRGQKMLTQTLASGSQSALMLFHEYALDARTSEVSRYVAKAVTCIHESYQRNITIADAAHRSGISQGYLSRLFKKETGYTFVDYLMYYRVKQAAHLLRTSELRICEVADLVGYSDQRFFSQIFKRIVGMLPRQFKEARDDSLQAKRHD